MSEIDENYIYDPIRLKTVKPKSDTYKCKDCIFHYLTSTNNHLFQPCDLVHCMPDERSDRQDVIFVLRRKDERT